MAKILCTCGELIYDSTDFIRNKARIIADQDYYDFFDAIEGKVWEDATTIATRYFQEIFQCNTCHNLILLRDGQRFDFQPIGENEQVGVLHSFLNKKWQGTMSARYYKGKGEIYWNTNQESGFRQNLSLDDLKKLYYRKCEELTSLGLLRHSFLSIAGEIVHSFKAKS